MLRLFTFAGQNVLERSFALSVTCAYVRLPHHQGPRSQTRSR